MAYEYYFGVNTDDDKGVPFGPVNKDNMDISRLIVDFSCWLDISESIIGLEHLAVFAEPPQIAPPWQANYPLDETSSIVVPSDTYPLEFIRNNVIQSGKAISLDVGAGTPGLTYAVSFVATAGVSLRRRLVDILMVIDRPLNPGMVALASGLTPVYTYPLVITATTILPYGFRGRVYIQNNVNAPIQVTLPPSPTMGDVVSFVDIAHTNGLFPVTVIGAPGSTVIGNGGTHVISAMADDDFGFEWTGTFWAVTTAHYGFLG